MVKLACNEQFSTLCPLTAHYSVGPFPAHVIFRPSRGPFILGLISTFVYLRPVTVIFCLWAKFSPWLQSARLWHVNMLGRFRSVIKIRLINDGPLWSAHERFQLYPIYGHNVVCYWPMFGQPIIRPVEGPLMIRPIEGPLCLRPV